MVIARATLVDALAATLSGPHGCFSSQLMARLGTGDTVSLDDAARIACAVLAELPEEAALTAIDRQTLVGADCMIRGEHVRLNREAALAHAALAGWVHPDIARQVASHLARIIDPSSISAATPHVRGLGALQVGSQLGCFAIDLCFPACDAVVTLQFGGWLDDPAPHRVLREIGGEALAQVGVWLRESVAPAASEEQSGATIH